MDGITVQTISPSDAKGLMRFAVLERSLLSKYPFYVSNFDTDVVRHLSGQSPAGKRFNICSFIGIQDGRELARCAALINPEYQVAKGERVGFIGYFAAAIECDSCVSSMLNQAEAWLKQQGVTRIIAPFNGNALMGLGFRTADFDQEPVMLGGWNPQYYSEYFTQTGYQAKYPMFAYEFDFSSPSYLEARDRVTGKHDFQIRPLNKKHWLSELDLFRTVINDNFIDEWLWYPISLDVFIDIFELMKPMIDVHQMLVAEVGGNPAGVVISYPDWNPLVRKFQGKAGNIEKIQFLLRGGRYKAAGIIIVAVNKEYRGKGIARALEMAVLSRYERLGLKKGYCHTVDEDNLASRKTQESAGGVAHLQYHAYDKNI